MDLVIIYHMIMMDIYSLIPSQFCTSKNAKPNSMIQQEYWLAIQNQ